MSSSMRFGSMPSGESGGGHRARARAGADVEKKKPNLKKVMPEIWKLVRPRRWLLVLGFGLMIVKTVAGLVLPFSTKFLIDRVLGQRGNLQWLTPLGGLVFLTQ